MLADPGLLVDRRRFLLGAVSSLAICRADPCPAVEPGPPANATIAVSSLAPGNFSANAFAGIASPGTTVFASGGFKFLKPNPDNDLLVCATTAAWRDQQITSWAGRGTFFLRLSGTPGSQTALFMTHNNAVAGGDIRIGIVTGFDETKCCDPSCGNGTYHNSYVNEHVAASPEGMAVGYSTTYAGQTLTFGCNGFEVYLQYNGRDLVRYTEWRLMSVGRMAIWAHQSYGTADVAATFLPLRFLHSDPVSATFDPRDFGMAQIDAVGAMSAGSNQLVLTTAAGYTVGQSIIVEIGGESGGGMRGTLGVGGAWPRNSYPTTAALRAAVPPRAPFWAYAADTNLVWSWNGSIWDHRNDNGGTYNQSYYSEKIVPLALSAKIMAVSADGKTLTLSKSAVASSTNAAIHLDCVPSLANILADPLADGVPAPSPMTISVPAGQFCFSEPVLGQNRAKLTISGQPGRRTRFRSPKGTQCITVRINNASFGRGAVTIQNIDFLGNFADNGYGLGIDAQGNYQTGPATCYVGFCDNSIIRNCHSVDIFSGAAEIEGSANPLIDSCSVTINGVQRAYIGWQIQLATCVGGRMQNCTAAGAKLLKSFELFACKGSKIVNCNGTNALYAINSSSSWVIEGCTATIQAGAYFGQLSGALDEPVINVNNNAFRSGSGGLIKNCNVIQQGYIDSRNNSLKAIQIQPTQTDCTIQGQYPGAAGCSAALAGLFKAPGYDSRSAEYGAMAVMSDAPRTTIIGIRSIGTAIGPPGHSGHFGNISLLGADSRVTNCVADVVHGGSQSGNQTNASFCR